MRNIITRTTLSWLLLVFFAADRVNAEELTYQNPILPGGYPDPSICRDGDYWYLVNSTFEYFPGLPIHRSRDLVNWELIGHGLHRESQVTGAVNLVDVQSDGGIHAPTIRCGNGRFYIITTNVYLPDEPGAQAQMVNFVITAENPAGPWSDPHVLDGAPGIDPDLFFDEDGRSWYVGTHSPENPRFPGEGEIWLQELDTENWTLKGQRHFLWRGACGGTWAEGPHLYRHDGRYYLLVAEGGTSFNHAVMIAAADQITGPYQSNPRNPILTSRHLGYDHWVNSTGHADLFQLPDGRWYLVALGIRGEVDRRSNMGRETHLVPVEWEREPFEWKEVKLDWPVASPLSGRLERHYPVPFEDTRQNRPTEFIDDFDGPDLGLQWNFRRYPRPGTWSLTENPGYLRLHASPERIRERGRAGLLGIRQTETAFSYETRMLFAPSNDETEAGMALFQKDDNYIAFTLKREQGKHILRLVSAEPGSEPALEKQAVIEDYTGEIYLKAEVRDGQYAFDWALHENGDYRELTRLPINRLLSRGYTGAYLGLFATNNGLEQAGQADFDWVVYTTP
jgi:alpha-N-arabinofuranosidase